MGKKYFAWSFDDGLEQDKKIIKILKEYGLGATFHLNSGLFGDKTYLGRIGNHGVTEKPADSFDPAASHSLSYVPHFRIPEDEVTQVYEGFEVASHTAHHVNLSECDEETRNREIEEDIKALSARFGQAVTGFAYPYGDGERQSKEALKRAGVRYARLVTIRPGFRFPEDPLAMPISCRHISPKAVERLHDFFQMDTGEDDAFFLMFSHGHEFDYGTEESSWDRFRRLCEAVAAQDDVIACSIGDAFRMHQDG